MKKYIHLVTASVLLASLTACSQQQVAGSSQQVAGGSQQVAGGSQQAATDGAKETAKDDTHCRGCNAPKVEPVIKPAPAPKPVAAVTRRPQPAPKPRVAYQPRKHVPTVPNKKNASSALVKNIQNALSAKGYNPGARDGVMGARTGSALNAFQKANGLPAGINQPTLRALGIK